MSSQINVNIDLRELYRRLPPKCKKILEEMVKEEIAKQLTDNLLKGES